MIILPPNPACLPGYLRQIMGHLDPWHRNIRTWYRFRCFTYAM